MLKYASQNRKDYPSEAIPKISLTFAFIVFFYVMGANFFVGNRKGRGYLQSFWNLRVFLASLKPLILCSSILYEKGADG